MSDTRIDSIESKLTALVNLFTKVVGADVVAGAVKGEEVEPLVKRKMEGEKLKYGAVGEGAEKGKGDNCKSKLLADLKELENEEDVSVGSWSDHMDQVDSSESSESSVVLPADRPRGKCPVVFRNEDELGEKFYANYVRDISTMALRQWLKRKGVTIRKTNLQELAIARYTTGTVPSVFLNGRDRVRGLAKVGDSVLTAVMADVLYEKSVSVSEMQDQIGRKLARTALTKTAVSSGLNLFCVLPSGVEASSASCAGECLEAIGGAVYRSGGMAAVRVYMQALGLL